VTGEDAGWAAARIRTTGRIRMGDDGLPSDERRKDVE
jgi:hypothetical protein